jgi:hypothetical protein
MTWGQKTEEAGPPLLSAADKIFHDVCDRRGVPREGRSSARAEHWSSVVREAVGTSVYSVSYLVAAFGALGPEGRKTAEAAYRLGGWRASVDYALAEYARNDPRGRAA